MIRPRNLAIPPILTIGAVSALLVAAAFLYRSDDAEPVVIPAPPVHDIAAPDVPVRMLTVDSFPDHYEGHFLWDGQEVEDHQWVGLDVADKSKVGDLIIATGRGTYSDSFSDVDFTFRIEANPATGEWTMWESEPEVAANFITEGRHEATFVEHADHISAHWLGDDGQNGRLVLNRMTTSVRGAGRKGSTFFEPAPEDSQFLFGGVRMQKRFVTDSTTCVSGGDDRVTVHYSGWNIEGTFDDSWERGQPATFKPNQLIRGWQTALHEMCEGDFARVWIPADQAYGATAPAYAPSGDLIFDIEIISID